MIVANTQENYKTCFLLRKKGKCMDIQGANSYLSSKSCWQGVGSRDGAMVREFRRPPMLPRFNSQIWGHMRVEFVGSLLCSERFVSRYSSFPLYNLRFDMR